MIGMVRRLPTESRTPAAPVMFCDVSMDKANVPLVAIAAVVAVGKYKPVLVVVVSPYDGVDADPSGV